MACFNGKEAVANYSNPENPADDEIPAYTVTNLTESKIKQINIEKYAARRVIKLFISHLLDTEVVKVHDKLEKHFTVKNVTFRNVMIKGVVVGVQFLTFKTRNRTLLSVDDGTGVMDCYVEESTFLEDTRSEVHHQLENSTKLFKQSEMDSVVMKAGLMILQSARVRMDKLPHYRSFRMGDSIRLIGTLSEYERKRSCFVTSIITDEETDRLDYQTQVEDLYEKL